MPNTNRYCKDCPVTRTDCGPWDDNDEYFKNILCVHKNHLRDSRTGREQKERGENQK